MKKTFYLSTKLLSILIILFFGVQLQAQIRGNGHIEEQIRALSGFNAITSTSSVDVYVKQGNNFSVVVRADGNLLNYVKTKVKNNTLIVSVTKSIWRARILEVHITMKNIQKVTLTGSGDFYGESLFVTQNLQFILTGSGDVKAALEAKNVQIKIGGSGDVDVSGIRGNLGIEVNGSGDVTATGLQLETCSLKVTGSGDVELKGRTNQLTMVVAGSGDIEAGGLAAVSVNAHNTGSGDAFVNAIDKLEVSLIGSGDLGYTGNPAVLKVNAAGSGEVYRK
ncbi:MAG: DUF2807 domain-containing protein [bacterium]|nr:MAG: DUF2807 domain-containing protein [bacterium]